MCGAFDVCVCGYDKHLTQWQRTIDGLTRLPHFTLTLRFSLIIVLA